MYRILECGLVVLEEAPNARFRQTDITAQLVAVGVPGPAYVSEPSLGNHTDHHSISMHSLLRSRLPCHGARQT